MTFCTFCKKPGHTASECWHKPRYIKEIRKENGKLKKTYYISTEAKPETRLRQRSPSPIQARIQKPKNKQRKECEPEKEQEVMLIKEIKPGPSNKEQPKAYRCSECIKWEIRLQHTLKEKDSLKDQIESIKQTKHVPDNQIINDRINKSLAEENKKLREERDAWKKLYEMKRQKK